MEMRPLGKSGIQVSKICLGTMIWGEQNTESEAHAQLDYAFEAGINFIDTAEMYPVPPMAKTCHLTEEYIGRWDKLRTARDKIILATKVVGPGFEWIRGGPRLTKEHVIKACEDSLRRLNVETIDLYQVHWPDRETNFFGRRGFKQPDQNEETTPIDQTLLALQDLIKTGKIRHYGLSNETPWGLSRWLHLADQGLGPRPVSVQNPYSLLNRQYEIGMAEFSYREKIPLLPYSPLAFGVLSGKYDNNQKPKDARLIKFDRFTRYNSDNTRKAAKAYNDLAREIGMTPAQMALAFVNDRFFVASTIIGATNIEQLKENISSERIKLSTEVLERIEQIHNIIPDPAP